MNNTPTARDAALDLLPKVLESFLSAEAPFSFTLNSAVARHLFKMLTERGVRCAYLDGRFTVLLD